MIFVFGSNLRGIHGAGAARTAVLYHGAIYGQGFGQQGSSFAIPTKDFYIQTLPLLEIGYYVDCFKVWAHYYKNEQFLVTRLGCGLAGYSNMHIGPLFWGMPKNCIMPVQWQEWSEGETKYHDEGRLIT